MADPKHGDEGKKGSSKGGMGGMIGIVLLTVIAAGGGFFLGTMLGVVPGKAPAAGAAQPAPEGGEAGGHGEPPAHGEGGHGDGGHGGGHGDKHGEGEAKPADKDAKGPPVLVLKEFAPIITNLANPDTSWVRLQASVVYDSKGLEHADVLLAQLSEDIIAYLRTLSLTSFEGADGLRHLHEDLQDRLVTRSEGRVREFIIQTIVVQ